LDKTARRSRALGDAPTMIDHIDVARDLVPIVPPGRIPPVAQARRLQSSTEQAGTTPEEFAPVLKRDLIR